MSLSEAAIISGDTDNYRWRDGYQRTMIYTKWDDANPRRLARVQIRVDRMPALSYATVDVWTPTGWQFVTAIGPEDFWDRMPGYERGQTTHANRDVLNLADDLMDRLIEIGI